jgi:hypothetical protein
MACKPDCAVKAWANKHEAAAMIMLAELLPVPPWRAAGAMHYTQRTAPCSSRKTCMLSDSVRSCGHANHYQPLTAMTHMPTQVRELPGCHNGLQRCNMTRQSLLRHLRRYGRELGTFKATIYLLKQAQTAYHHPCQALPQPPQPAGNLLLLKVPHSRHPPNTVHLQYSPNKHKTMHNKQSLQPGSRAREDSRRMHRVCQHALHRRPSATQPPATNSAGQQTMHNALTDLSVGKADSTSAEQST